MKPVSIHLHEKAYREMKSLAAERGRPVAELVRQAMDEYLEKERVKGLSLVDRRPHASGRLLEAWTREELLEEMLRL
jgi:16S rRNA U516 pseudouridylate synthase RsuA-like enzyme